MVAARKRLCPSPMLVCPYDLLLAVVVVKPQVAEHGEKSAARCSLGSAAQRLHSLLNQA